MIFLLAALFTYTGAQTPGDEYRFEPDISRWVGVHHASTFDVGKFDEAAAFHPDKGLMGLRRVGFLSGVPAHKAINLPFGDNVYEYRSGILIPGDIDGWGEFVPDVGGRIIPFRDYRYSLQARRIYNLPGRFVKVKRPDQ